MVLIMKRAWMAFAFVLVVVVACGGRVTDNCQFCDQKCVDTMTDVFNCGGCRNTCIVGHSCVQGKCTGTPSGSTSCQDPSMVDCGDGTCSNLTTDAHNCGACGLDCGGGACHDGVCTTASCVADDVACEADSECCSSFCASDGFCGCIPTDTTGCIMDSDCCSGICGANNVCN